MTTNTIENLLMEWGQSQRQMPVGGESVKAKILASLSTQPASTISPAPKFNFAWLSLTLAAFAVATFFIIPTLKTNQSFTQSLQTTSSTPPINAPAPLADKSDTYLRVSPKALSNDLGSGSAEIWPQPPVMQQTTPSSDNREFLKTDFSANIQTRNVQDLTSQIQTTVRGFGGRVDSSSNTPQSGYISFVVPASQFEAFRSQVKGLVNYRFYSETTQTQNLLPQKLDIEGQQKQTSDTLAQLQSSKDQLTADHKRTLASLNSQLQAANQQLTALQNETTNDVGRAMQIEQQKQSLTSQINNLKSRLSSENYNYGQQLDSYNSQIQWQQKTLDGLNTQTNNLLDNVATVNGTISINWISLWDAFNLYVPADYWVPVAFLLAAIAIYWISKKQSQFILP